MANILKYTACHVWPMIRSHVLAVTAEKLVSACPVC